MPCCKADEFDNWCEGEDLFEHEDEQYCVFHLPHDSPHKPEADEFNVLVFERIDQAIKDDNKCDLSGTTFPGDVNFIKYNDDNALPIISFNSVEFRGDADFLTAKFKANAFFRSAMFEGNANFRSAIFGGYADLRSASFKGYADIRSASFKGYASFNSATFMGYANFISTTFKDYASFVSTIFNWYADFNSAAFRGYTNFSKGTFKWQADFSVDTFGGYTDFSLVTFTGHVDFTLATFSRNVDFSKGAFNGSAFFKEATFNRTVFFVQTRWLRNTYFTSVCFKGTVDFLEAELAYTSFNRAIFKKPVLIRRCLLWEAKFRDCLIDERLEFDRCDMGRVSLINSPLEAMQFIDCCWPHSRRRTVVYDARRAAKKGYFKLDDVGEPEELSRIPVPGQLQDLFRMLKKKAKDDHNESLAGDWHYWEKEMQRIKHMRCIKHIDLLNLQWWKNLGMHLLLSLYRLSSGYGESPGTALMALLALFVIPTAGYFILGHPQDPGQYVPLVKSSAPADAGYLMKLGQGFYRVLMTIQAAMLGLAIRNKMRR